MENMFISESVTKSDRILHTPGIFAKSALLYVQEVGKLQSLIPHVCKRGNLDSYLLFAVLDGSGNIIYEGKKYDVHKGECVWIDCHQVYEHISSADNPWQLVWVHFNGKCLKDFYDFFKERSKKPIFIPTDFLKVQGLIEKVLSDMKENISELVIHSLLTQLVVECVQLVDSKDKIKEIREFINLNYKDNNLIALLSEHFQSSKSDLEEAFEASYGIGLRDYILNRKLNAAKELLRFTIQPMEKVVEESGIRDEDLFYRLFKENEGVSPEEYRHNWAQWIKD